STGVIEIVLETPISGETLELQNLIQYSMFEGSETSLSVVVIQEGEGVKPCKEVSGKGSVGANSLSVLLQVNKQAECEEGGEEISDLPEWGIGVIAAVCVGVVIVVVVG